MQSEKLSVKVIVGSTREGRFCDKAALWIESQLKKCEYLTVEMLDLRDFTMPFFNSAESPAYKKESYKNEEVARFTDKINEGDAFIVVTPEYNHSTSAVLKNAMDWVYHEWGNKPIGFVSYGSVGGARAIEHLRLVAIELQMAPIREAVHIAGGDFFPVAQGNTEEQMEMLNNYKDKADAMITQLQAWAWVFKAMRS